MTDRESDRYLKRYIGPRRSAKIILWTAFLVTAGLILTGYLVKDNVRKKATLYDAMYSVEGSYCYMDSIGVSSPIYNSGSGDSKKSAYISVDPNGYFNIVYIHSGDIGSMTRQKLYWSNGKYISGETYRLYGIVKELDPNSFMLKYACEVADVEAEDYPGIYGYRYLDCTLDPAIEKFSLFILISEFTGLFWAIMLMCCSPQMIRSLRCRRYLRKTGKTSEAAAELEYGTHGNALTAGREFFFVRYQGAALSLDSVKIIVEKQGRKIYIETDCAGKFDIINIPEEEADELMHMFPQEMEKVRELRTITME